MTTWFFSLQTDTFYSKIRVRLDAVPFFLHTEPPHTEREVYTMRTPRLRLLSAILAVALFFTLLPVSALAEDSGSNANTGLTIGIVGNLNQWDESHSISMKEVSPAVYEVTIENKSYGDINGSVGFLFVKDNSYADQWGSSVTASSGELRDAVYGGDYITIDPGSDVEESTHNFIIRLDLTNWNWNTKTGATFTVTVAAATNTFYFDETTGTITKYAESDTVVVIPPTISSWPVTKIGEDALKDNTTITSVTIPANVTEIGSNAFAGCTNLTSVNYEGDWSNLTIQSGNPAVQDAAKDAANEQLFDFEFTPDNTAVIVKHYRGAAADVTIPSRYKGKPVTAIGTDAFLGLNITSVTIPDSVTVIRSRAFSDCRNLTNINIPSSITFIGNYAFSNCESLTSITIPSSVTSIEESAFSRCSKLSSISIPDSISSIPAMAFNSCTDLATVSIPNSVTSIGYRAFYNCSKLSTVDYGGSKTQWNNLNKVGGNDPLLNATLVCAKLEATFDPDNGESISTQTIDRGEMFTKPAAPSKENHTFAGWYNGDEKFDFDAVPTDDVTLTAKWEKNAPVLPDTYALNVSGAFVYVDGVDVTAPAGDTTLQLEKDASVRLVADPDRMPSGMVFDRWTILNGALNADDAEKFETGRTLEEFAFTMPAEPLSIEATPRMQEEEGSDTASVIAGVALGTAATALVAWQAYDLGMSLYQEHWLPADFVMPKTRAELALLLWNTAGRPAPAAQPAFADITDPDTAQAAQWAVETGLMTPKSADRFKPEKSVTRWKAVRSWKRVTNQNT